MDPFKIVKPGDEDANYRQKYWQIVNGLMPVATLSAHGKQFALILAAAPTLAQKLREVVEWLEREIECYIDRGDDNYTHLEELRDDLAETLRKLEG